MPRRVELPGDSERPGLPLDAGHIVNNSETLLNIYNAFFLGKPVTTEYLQVFGPERDRDVHRLLRFLDRSPIFPIFGAGTNLWQPVY